MYIPREMKKLQSKNKLLHLVFIVFFKDFGMYQGECHAENTD